MFGLTARATIKAVWTAAVLTVALGTLYGIASLTLDPWWMKLVLAAPSAALIVAGALWVLSGGEQGTHIEVVDGNRRVSITNANVFARSLTRAVLDAFERAPLPLPAGRVRGGNPADLGSLVEEPTALPDNVPVADAVIDVPPDAARLR